jgi:hypothetical protein
MFWVDVLNQALAWSDTDWLRREPRAAQAATMARADAFAALQQDVALLRRVFASYYIDVELTHHQIELLNQWLAAVTLQISPSRDAVPPYPLRAARQRAAYPEPLDVLLSSALVQLVGVAQETTLMTAIHRCHGVQRVPTTAGAVQAGQADWPPELEERFARKAGIQALLTTPLRQCSRLVVSERGSRYCSKACSNASFAARKSRDDPRYFAYKQERYRRRKEKRPPGEAARLDRGAFVYMD